MHVSEIVNFKKSYNKITIYTLCVSVHELPDTAIPVEESGVPSVGAPSGDITGPLPAKKY